MRCKYCRTLITHRFNGNYNRMDRKRKLRHERMCPYNPEVIENDLKSGILRGKLLKIYFNIKKH